MNSHAHVILELPEPKEVSMIWDLNLSASFSSQDFSREREDLKIEDLNTLPCRVRVVFSLQWVGGSIPNEFRGTFLQRERKHTEALIGRHPIGHL